MTDFSHFAKAGPTVDATRDFALYDLDTDPVPYLTVRPATDVNKPYANDLLRRAAKEIPRNAGQRVDVATLETGRDIERESYAEHVVVGWKGVKDANGDEVPFSVDNCREFLRQIPSFIFDSLRNFCAEPRNFTSRAISATDVEELGKN